MENTFFTKFTLGKFNYVFDINKKALAIC